MKKRIFGILLATILLLTGCSYIEYTEGADTNKTSHENVTSSDDTIIDSNGTVQGSETQSELDDIITTENEKNLTSSTKVHIIDVKQGDSILVESDDKYMLIDAGERNQANVVIDYLESVGVKKIDYLIGTHPHSDHIGGLADVIKSFQIGKIIMPNVVHTSKTFEYLLDTISNKDLKITKPIIGNEFNIGAASFVVIAPNSSSYDNLNNYSVAIKLINENNIFIFTGDAEISSENEMLNNGINLDADVLKLGHHGSSTSSGDKFLDVVTPVITIISAGEGNQYGHPHVEILQTLKERNIKLFRTDKQGTIILESDGKTITFNKSPYEISNEDLSKDSSLSGNTNNTTITDKSDTDTITANNDASSDNNPDDSKSIVVHITKTGAKYHRANCRHLKSDIEVTLEEALNKGLEPCKTCKPPTI